MFDFIGNASNSSLNKSETLPFSFLCTTLNILDSPESLDPTAIYEKLVTHSYITLNTKLFSLLSNANGLKVSEPKTYKQAVSNQNPHYNDWTAAM